ncbi:MAG: phosphoglucosamine mutase [Reyranellaceae bacterium]
MTRKLFGTDGVRGRANLEPMTAETALRLGMAAGLVFNRGDHRHQVVIGKDTRLSGYLLEPALTAGFLAIGMDVVLLGPVPTPAVSMLARSLRADLGVMISASHNPYHDNGIKLFGPDGYKLSDETEAEIEALMASDLAPRRAAADMLGRARRLDDALGRYAEFVKTGFPRGRRLDGLKIVVDGANGAAYKVAPAVLWELGAEIVPIGVSPDGFNINRDCGSTHPQALAREVVAHRADLGIALDGDADRLVVVDEKGEIVDGDQLMGVIAECWRQDGRLRGNCLVTTVMSNLGLERFLQARGIAMVRTQVGDRYVLEKMREGRCNLGGEQSGHIIMSDFATTGDGLMAALQALAVLVQSGRPASEVFRVFQPVPQILKNVRLHDIARATATLESAVVRQAIAAGESALNGKGRLLIRRSGTEPLIRVMAEGDDAATVQRVVDDIAGAVAAQAG